MKKPVVLCIMDGFGKNDSDYGNAIVSAKKPNLDKIMAEKAVKRKKEALPCQKKKP